MKSFKIAKSTKYLVVLVLLVLPFVVSAALLNPGTDCNKGLGQACTATSLPVLIRNIINIILSIAGLVAVLFIIIGGFQYMTSAGNEELAERGKKNLQNAIIGVIIIVLSFVIVSVISTLLVNV